MKWKSTGVSRRPPSGDPRGHADGQGRRAGAPPSRVSVPRNSAARITTEAMTIRTWSNRCPGDGRREPERPTHPQRGRIKISVADNRCRARLSSRPTRPSAMANPIWQRITWMQRTQSRQQGLASATARRARGWRHPRRRLGRRRRTDQNRRAQPRRRVADRTCRNSGGVTHGDGFGYPGIISSMPADTSWPSCWNFMRREARWWS